MKKSIVCLLALMVVSLTASAEIYRWVDAQGRVHYSDRPVPGATVVRSVTSQRSDPAAIAERDAALARQRETAAANARQEQTNTDAAKAVQKDMAKLADERCKKAQEAYRIAIESQRLYRVNKDGEREYLTDAEIEQARINAKKTLDEACPKQGG